MPDPRHAIAPSICPDPACLFRHSPAGCGFGCGAANYPPQDFDLFSPAAVHAAYRKCRRRKRGTVNAQRFEADLENQIFSLSEELRSGTYRPGRSVVFLVEKPKRREIFAADFRDRVVHHLLVGYLEPHWEKRFIFDSHACRTSKGVHLAVQRAQTFARSVTANGTRQAFYLQLDIHGFFMNIDRRILFERLARHERHPLVQDLIRRIVFHDPKDGCIFRNCRLEGCLALPPHKSLFQSKPWCGLPIGNLTSQFFANVYLDALDQFVKHTLRCRYYLRYCDDFVLMDVQAERLAEWKNAIEAFLSDTLRLALNPKDGRVSPSFPTEAGTTNESSPQRPFVVPPLGGYPFTVEAGTANRRLQGSFGDSYKCKLRPIRDGIDFLGYVIRPDYLLVRRRVVGNLKQRLSALEQRLQQRGTGILPVGPQTARPGAANTHHDHSAVTTPLDSVAARSVRFPRDEVESCRQWLHSYMGHFKLASTHRLRAAVFERHPILTAWYLPGSLRLRYPVVAQATSFSEQLRLFRRMFRKRWIFVEIGGRWKSMPSYAYDGVADLLGVGGTVPMALAGELKRTLAQWHIPTAWIRQEANHNGFIHERSVEELIL
jgi:plasmid stabilization system protein ParE